MGHRYTILFACLTIYQALPLCALDNSHFYRARLCRGEPRTAKSVLSSFDVSWVGASAHGSKDGQGLNVPLLSIFDPHLFTVDDGHVSTSHPFLSGQFALSEVQIDKYVNLESGFFFHVNLPVRRLCLSDIEPHFKKHPANKRQERHREHYIKHIEKSGAGDLSVLAGWAHTRYDAECVDFADLALQAGMLIPTARPCTTDPTCLILPLGQGGSFGIPLVASAAVGFLNWITFGAYVEGLFLFERNDLMRLRSPRLQKPTKRDVYFKPGTIWDISVYAKADHFMKGFSFLFGYSHNQQQPADVRSVISSVLPRSPQLDGWSMDIMHIVLEYDWADEDNEYGPRIGFNYNRIVGGKRIFKASTAGMYFGIDFVWNF